jgi:hypothetical protein
MHEGVKGDFVGSDGDYFFQEIRSPDKKTGTDQCPFVYAHCKLDPIPRPLFTIPRPSLGGQDMPESVGGGCYIANTDTDACSQFEIWRIVPWIWG